jgi:hypothetical protein
MNFQRYPREHFLENVYQYERESLKSGDQQCHQYQQSEQSPLT